VLSYSESLHPTLDLWDVNQLVAGVYAGMRDDFELAGVDCRLDFAQGLPPARLDYKMLSYCLRAIARSVLASLAGGGSMAIRTRRRDDELLLVVAGRNGDLAAAAMPPDGPFPAAEEAGQLGLSLCGRIIKEHGARLDSGSEPDGGVAFTIRLPIPKEE
jgi:signal transduction histidine kinase